MNVAADWMKLFPDDRSREAYRRAMLSRAPMSWEVIEDSQEDLLELIVGRVSADIGVQVILGVSLLFRGHSDAERASQSLLSMIMNDIAPPRARTMLIAMCDAWDGAQRQPPYKGPDFMRAAVARAVRRLIVLDIPDSERNALRTIQDMLADNPA